MTEPNATPTANVIGLGLIGGSIALGLRRRGWRVCGEDASPDTLASALDREVVGDLGERNVARRVLRSDLEGREARDRVLPLSGDVAQQDGIETIAFAVEADLDAVLSPLDGVADLGTRHVS